MPPNMCTNCTLENLRHACNILMAGPFLMTQHMHNGGMIEPGLTALWFKILSANCQTRTADRRPPLVVDVGANFGWFTFMSASMGCR